MNSITKLTFLLLFGLSLKAQTLSPNPSTLSFGNTNELQANTRSVSLVNPNAYPISISSVDRFSIYGNKVFSVSDSVFTINGGDSLRVDCSFLPEHNIQHQQVLIFKSNSGFGHAVVEVNGQGTYSNNYYISTRNKSQEQLKTALSSRLAQGYTSLSYNAARDQMYASIDNNGGQVECVYTGRTATFNTRAGANSNSFNCEHTFPQGFFNSNVPMRSDIHHLFPTDVSANSRRGNDPFGVVNNASWTQGGSKSGGGKFEPRDLHKGAVARAMMYFVLRYQDYSNHFSGQESILRQWHDQYPPTQAERNRNQAIYGVQNNRNPFVDYPQFIERISDIDGNAQAPSSAEFYYSDDTIYLAQGNQGQHSYHFIIYGQGSDAGTLSNFTLSDTRLNFSNGNPGSLSLNHGDYLDLGIDFRSEEVYNATLSFDAFGSRVEIPIVSGVALGAPSFDKAPAPSFFPNPTTGILNLSKPSEILSLQLISQDGKAHHLSVAPQINLSDFPAGLYLLKYQTEQGLFQQKLLVQ